MAQTKIDTFYDLTPGCIHRAFESAGLELEPTITFLNSLENRVVRVQDVEGERWVGKFYRPGRWTKAALLEEHDFLQELLEEDLPVVAPVELEGGSTLGCIEGIWFCVFPYHVGRPCAGGGRQARGTLCRNWRTDEPETPAHAQGRNDGAHHHRRPQRPLQRPLLRC